MILAEADGPRRYETSRSLVKHAGLSPADTASGAFEGSSRISRRGRPALRTAAWRADVALPDGLLLSGDDQELRGLFETP